MPLMLEHVNMKVFLLRENKDKLKIDIKRLLKRHIKCFINKIDFYLNNIYYYYYYLN